MQFNLILLTLLLSLVDRVTGVTLQITNFANLWTNSFGQNQGDGGSLNAYSRTWYQGVDSCYMKSAGSGYWYSRFISECSSSCSCYNINLNTYRYLRFKVKGFRASGGSINVFMQSHPSTDCIFNGANKREGYQKITSWAIDGNGYEYGEVMLSSFNNIEFNKIFSMGFVELTPTWTNLYFYSVSLESDFYPNCPNNCNNRGTCNFGGTCTCNAGYTGSDCGQIICPGNGNCLGRGTCNSATGICSCFSGYTGAGCGCNVCPGNGNCNNQGSCQCSGTCICNTGFRNADCGCRVCPGNGNCNNQGTCNCDGTCTCNNGFRNSDCGCRTCPSNCNGRGACNCDGTCSCNTGYWGSSCECTSINCNGRGTNNCAGTCTCNAGFWGANCQCITANCNGRGTNNCDGTCTCTTGFWGANCQCITKNCNGRGTNNCDGTCTCNAGFWGSNCQCIAKNCNNGVTNCDGTCTCNAGWRGSDCTCKTCPANCNGRGTCNCDGTCTCNSGFWGSDCGCTSCPGSPLQCNGQGTCRCDGQCLCGTGYLGSSCNCKTCPENCNGKGTCNCDGTCTCNPGFLGTTCSCISKDCKNGATLNCDGSCTCKPGFWGHDCSCIFKTCKYGINNCNGTCTCDSGWWGSDCSCKSCPSNCNNRGICNCNGTCTCNSGFYGSDCGCITAKCSARGTQNCDGSYTCHAGFWGSDCSCIYKNCNNGVNNCNGTCTCDTGYWGTDCSCISKNCTGKGNSTCDGFCKCEAQYWGSDCSCLWRDCKNGAALNCDGTCTCRPGYWGADCSCITSICNKGDNNCNGSCSCYTGWRGGDCSCRTCPLDCSENGICNCDGTCSCKDGFWGSDCSCKKCPLNCNGKGSCNCNGTCTCHDGFQGADCNCKTCPNSCSGRGTCRCDGTCNCQLDYQGSEDCLCKTRVSGTCANGNGTYNCGTGTCNCKPGFSGELCDCNVNCQPSCKNGGSCLCSGSCSCPSDWQGSSDCSCKTRIKGKCQNSNGSYECETGNCACLPGWSGPLCDCPTTCNITCNNGGICKCGVCQCPADWTGSADCSCKTPVGLCHSGTGKYNCSTGNCICQPGWTGPLCDCNQNCPNGCSGKGVCKCDGTCQCDPGYMGSSDCSCKTVVSGTCLNSHPLPTKYICSSGACNCSEGWNGTLCDCKTKCPNNCSGKGICNCGTCICNSGWTGSSDCSCKTPVGQCINGFGTYDCLTGNCICQPGWTGPQCDCQTSCPNNCSGYGECCCGKCICPADRTKAPDCSCKNPVYGETTCIGIHNCTTGLCDKICPNGNCSLSCISSTGSIGCDCNDNCLCLPGYYGDSCECKNVSAPCQNNGTAKCDGTCACTDKYTGTFCNNKMCPPDCVNYVGCDGSTGKCICEDGFHGDKCEKRHCPFSCKNNGACGDDGKCICPNEYLIPPDCKCLACNPLCSSAAGSSGCNCIGECVCYSGYYGKLCEKKICSKPCFNGGVCSSQGICSCNETYAGVQCEIDLCISSSGTYYAELCNARLSNGRTTNTSKTTGPTPEVVRNVLLITNFNNLYFNDLNLDQGSTFSTYFKSPQGAIVGSFENGVWFTRLAARGTYFSILDRFNYLRFEVKGFQLLKGSFMTVLTSEETVEEYVQIRTWLVDPESGFEVGEVNLGSLALIDKSKLSVIGFTYLYPLNETFLLKAVYLDSESRIQQIRKRISQSSITNTITSEFQVENVSLYPIIIAASVITLLAFSTAFVMLLYYRRRSKVLQRLRANELTSMSQRSVQSSYAINSFKNNSMMSLVNGDSSFSRNDFSMSSVNNSMSISITQAMTGTGSIVAVPGYLTMKRGIDFEFHEDQTVIGKGGTSSLFVGRLLNANAQMPNIAVKLMIDDGVDEEAEKHFFYEIAIMNIASRHPNIVKFIGFDTDVTSPHHVKARAIIMKLYHSSLKTFLSKEPMGSLTTFQIVGITKDIAAAMSYLHDNGILHLDLKPHNVLLEYMDGSESNFRCVVCDFGYANLVDNANSFRGRRPVNGLQIPTKAGITARYAAPELFERIDNGYSRFNSQADKAIDVYAFSMTIYEVVTQSPPWVEAADIFMIRNLVLSGKRPPLERDIGNLGKVKFEAPMLLQMIEATWAQAYIDRPSFRDIIGLKLFNQPLNSVRTNLV